MAKRLTRTASLTVLTTGLSGLGSPCLFTHDLNRLAVALSMVCGARRRKKRAQRVLEARFWYVVAPEYLYSASIV